jgi:hypothetical protein
LIFRGVVDIWDEDQEYEKGMREQVTLSSKRLAISVLAAALPDLSPEPDTGEELRMYLCNTWMRN